MPLQLLKKLSPILESFRLSFSFQEFSCDIFPSPVSKFFFTTLKKPILPPLSVFFPPGLLFFLFLSPCMFARQSVFIPLSPSSSSLFIYFIIIWFLFFFQSRFLLYHFVFFCLYVSASQSIFISLFPIFFLFINLIIIIFHGRSSKMKRNQMRGHQI